MIIIVFFLTVFYVFLKAFQQRNVTMDKKNTILPVSLMMGICEYTGIGIAGVEAATHGILAASTLGVSAGLGGAIGCYAAIYLHKRMH